MAPDAHFDRLRGLAVPTAGAIDPGTFPLEAYEAWKQGGVRFGKFVLLGELGRGGTSVVYRAYQCDLRRDVALKLVSGLNPELRERFLREARVGARLSHAAVLPVFETGEADGTLWLAMPLVKGVTLDEAKLGAREAALAVAQAARGVHAAHEAGVFHRDLKPRNIMRSEGGAVTVMDFGLALAGSEATRISMTGQVLGTPQYMAPEQASGGDVDARTDVYGLGATLYRLVAGRAPYPTETLAEFLSAVALRDPDPPSRAAAVPRDLETIVLKAMDRNPARRYPSAAALADDLERFAAGESVLGKRAPASVRTWRAARRHPVVLVALLGLLGAALAFGVASSRSPHPRPPAVDGYAAVVRGRELRNAGQARQAIAEFASVPAGDLSWPDAQLEAADCHYWLHEYKAAAEAYGRYLSVRPDDPTILRERASCLLETGDLDTALAEVSRALNLKPGAADLLHARACIRIRSGETALALADLDAALASDPDNGWIRASRARLHAGAGRLVEALRDFDVAIERGGRGTEWLRDRGRLRLQTRDYAGAIEDLNEAVRVSPPLEAECAPDIAAAKEALQAIRGKE